MRLRLAIWLGRVYVYEVWRWGGAAMGVTLDPGKNPKEALGQPTGHGRNFVGV